MTQQTFRLGDRVKWKSENGAEHEGLVERVCPPGYQPKDLFPVCGGPRRYESYVIRTAKRSRDKGKLFWPLPHKLRSV